MPTPWLFYLLTSAHWLVVVGLMLRIIMRRPSHGIAFAWLTLIVLIPVLGAATYFLIGERRIGHRRTRSIAKLRMGYPKILSAVAANGLSDIDWDKLDPSAVRLDQLGRNLAHCPTVRGNTLELRSKTFEILAELVRDIDRAKHSVLMEFYIWSQGGDADAVLDALIRAAGRGVKCRVLIDAIGARPWWRGSQPRRMRDAGIEVVEALPVGLFRTIVGRTDLRLHRKIVIIDGEIAWTGSMNMVDPRYFKQHAGVGEWVDAMVRVRGAAVGLLGSTFIGDWQLETQEPLAKIVADAGLKLKSSGGQAEVQVFSSGPGESGDGLLQMIIETINSSDHELTLTTPYLVPDDALLRAIRLAAGRGVCVRLILPEKVDSLLTRYASRSYFDDLLSAGVEIHLFRSGLLHTKSILADRSIAMFGTANLDMRSLWLNYEVALFIFDSAFAQQVHKLHEEYLAGSVRLDAEAWARRSYVAQFAENTMRLMSPLL